MQWPPDIKPLDCLGREHRVFQIYSSWSNRFGQLKENVHREYVNISKASP